MFVVSRALSLIKWSSNALLLINWTLVALLEQQQQKPWRPATTGFRPSFSYTQSRRCTPRILWRSEVLPLGLASLSNSCTSSQPMDDYVILAVLSKVQSNKLATIFQIWLARVGKAKFSVLLKKRLSCDKTVKLCFSLTSYFVSLCY